MACRKFILLEEKQKPVYRRDFIVETGTAFSDVIIRCFHAILGIQYPVISNLGKGAPSDAAGMIC